MSQSSPCRSEAGSWPEQGVETAQAVYGLARGWKEATAMCMAQGVSLHWKQR